MNKQERIEHYIITRFSIYTGGKSFNGDLTRLFDKRRLETRFLIFETFCLPSILGQTSKNFIWIILIDPLLPKPYLKRLKDAVKGHSMIHLVKYLPHINLNSLSFIEKYVGKISTKYVITTRLDDDDALSSDFVKRIQQDCQKRKNKDLLFISYPKGLHWRPNKKAKYGIFSNTYYESIALGLSLVTVKSNYPLTVYGWNHVKIVSLLDECKNNPKSKLYKLAKASGDKIENWNMKKRLKIIKTRRDVYLRAIHGENDAAKITSKRFFNKINKKINLSKFSLNPKKVAAANSILTSEYFD
jgi:hypothetical protein